MSPRRLLPALLAVPLLAAVLAPRVADACSPPDGFFLERTYPAADAVDIPLDTDLILAGTGYYGATVRVELRADGELVEGVLYPLSDGRYAWDPSELLLAETVYEVHVETESEVFDPPITTHDFKFTTAKTIAAEAPAPTITSFEVELYEQEVDVCVAIDEYSAACDPCAEYETRIEQRRRMIVELAQPVGRYDGFYGSVVEYGVDENTFLDNAFDAVWQGPDAGPTRHVIDLTDYGGWQVCLRVHGNNPVDPYLIVDTSAKECIDLRDFEVDTDTDTAPTTGDESEAGTDTDDGSTDGSQDGGDKAGCGCRSSEAPVGSLALLVLGLAAVRPRRRAR